MIPFRYLVIFVTLFALGSCRQNEKLFGEVDSSHSGVHFNNVIVEKDSLNPIDEPNIYNGGGVGIGDFNNDGLQDIYFTANTVSNKLYLNKGDLQFEDVTESAGVTGDGKWSRGVSVIDINNDGWLDLYVCVTIDKNPERRRNLLYINQGADKQGKKLAFKESAAAYGLDDTTHSTMASFFDYDNDGDLDMYLVVNQILPWLNPSNFKPKITDGSFPSTGRLFQNSWDSTLGHPKFKNVTKTAGLSLEGYGHGVTIADINRDGWKDIFVTNDFIANDLLYINNGDGTFTDKAATFFKHTSANGMGQDIIDINNDGLSDVVELDMNPEDNYRKKMMLNASNYHLFQLNDFFKYQYQYVRNSLQINQGPTIRTNDSIGDPVFSDLGYFSGIAETDWSWAPLVADFDNDGFRDIIVSNGYPKDVTDHDFIAYRKESAPSVSESNTLAQIPQVKLHNYAFRNTGDCRFKDVSADWGLSVPSFSNGAAYADLDNDGDLEIVFNNINDEASIYENRAFDSNPGDKNYLNVQLKGDSANMNGFGAWVELYYGDKQQAYEMTPYRGYLSTIQYAPHFGLGKVKTVDSLIVLWPGGLRQVIMNVQANQSVSVNKSAAGEQYDWGGQTYAGNSLFKDITDSVKVLYKHIQTDYIDFDKQSMLPRKFSEFGPSLAGGDVNGDGLDDIIAGGNSSMPTVALLQTGNGSFVSKTIIEPREKLNVYTQDMGMVLFDADKDGDLDLYVSRGGYESKPNTAAYQDQFYINDGHANFTPDSLALPKNLTSKSCVRASDFDHDGDLDLFVGGRIEPWNYPKPVSSAIYRNDSKNGRPVFTDVTKELATGLINIGLVSDAVFTDFDNDGWQDLVIVGDWMPISFFKNNHGKFLNVTPASGIANQTGWWNSVVSADFDNDGDIDYVIGNLGLNSYYKGDPRYPVSIYAKDFDRNKSYDAFMSLYLPASQEDTTRKEFPSHLRDDALRQMVTLRKKFPDYNSFARATMDNLFSREQLEGALVRKAINFSSSFCRNEGNGKFTLTDLPFQAQLSALNGMIANDFNGDGNIDIVINTNDYGSDVMVGRYDALNGLLLTGDGKGGFTPKTILESGIFIPGNGKALIKLRDGRNNFLLAASQNRDLLKVYRLRAKTKSVMINPDDVVATITYANGNKQQQEFYYGNSFLSQSARFLTLSPNVVSVLIRNSSGDTRQLKID